MAEEAGWEAWVRMTPIRAENFLAELGHRTTWPPGMERLMGF